jgi:hypothetical protein
MNSRITMIENINTTECYILGLINKNNNGKIMPEHLKSKTILVITLSLPLVLGITVSAMPLQAANAQLSSTQQQALKSLVTTGFTNHYPLTVGGKTFSIPYSIKEGQVVGMLADQPRTSLDIVIAPTQFAKTYGILTVQIPRDLLDSKKPDKTDKPFAIKIDGHGLFSKELQNTNTYRTIGLLFNSQNGFVEIFGSQLAH